MQSFDDRINKQMERLEQLKRQKKAHEGRDKKRQEAISRERQRIVGAIFLEQFPEFSKCQPKRTMTENQIEFAILTHFISGLAANTEYISRLKERTAKKKLSSIQRSS